MLRKLIITLITLCSSIAIIDAKKEAQPFALNAQNIEQHGQTITDPKSIDLTAKNKFSAKNSTYKSPIITIMASTILLKNCTVEGVLVLDKATQIIFDSCIINSLVIHNMEKNLDVQLNGSSVVQGDVMFVGNEGIINKKPQARIQGTITNGKQTTT